MSLGRPSRSSSSMFILPSLNALCHLSTLHTDKIFAALYIAHSRLWISAGVVFFCEKFDNTAHFYFGRRKVSGVHSWTFTNRQIHARSTHKFLHRLLHTYETLLHLFFVARVTPSHTKKYATVLIERPLYLNRQCTCLERMPEQLDIWSRQINRLSRCPGKQSEDLTKCVDNQTAVSQSVCLNIPEARQTIYTVKTAKQNF